MMKAVLLKNGFLVTPQQVMRSDIVLGNVRDPALREPRIEFISGQTAFDKVMDISGKYVVPGFIDIHFHGYNLFEFTIGLYNQKTDTYDNSQAAYEQGFDMLSRKLAEFGVTGFYLSTWAAPIETLKVCYGRLADYLSKVNDTSVGARLLGGCLEGTFINPDMAGAMNPEMVLEPAPNLFERIEDRGTIKLANVVPDAGRKSCELTKYLTDKGIVVGAGHTNATCSQVADAIKAGLKYSIHFTNGPTGGSYKPFEGGGAIEAVLQFDELYAEQICDGFHVNPAYVRDIIKRKGVDKILGVTDCTFVAGSDLRQFTIAGVRGAVSDDGGYFHVVGKPNTLFSSNLTMNRGFANLLNWLTTDMQGIWNRRHEAMGLEKALVATSKIFSTNACKLTGLEKEGYGSVVDGAKADLCVLDITGSPGNYKVTVELTIVNGNTVYSAK
jgi:N-acetylglucosamine-6-phosphate deacetylase